MKFSFFIFLSFWSYGQVRMISHISKETGGFVAGIIITNSDEQNPRTVTFTPYNQFGTQLDVESFNFYPASQIYVSISELFHSDDVSHFAIESDAGISVTTTYMTVTGMGSPVHVPESSTQSRVWIVNPGNWDYVWDGLALVNTGDFPANVSVLQKNSNGEVVTSQDLVQIAPMGKSLFVLNGNFQEVGLGHFEVWSDQKLAITSLRGSLDNTYLWENQATPFDPASLVTRVHQSGTLTLEANHGFDFSSQMTGDTNVGDFYYYYNSSEGTGSFWANNAGMMGVIDLGVTFGSLAQAPLPTYGFSQNGVSFLPGSTLVSLAAEGEEGFYIAVRILEVNPANTKFEWAYVSRD